MDLYYKRFVRDYLHYTDVILCKSAAIVDRLLREGGGSYISFHIRRGDFQVSKYNETNYSFCVRTSYSSSYLPILVQRDEAFCRSDSREYRPLHVSEQSCLLISQKTIYLLTGDFSFDAISWYMVQSARDTASVRCHRREEYEFLQAVLRPFSCRSISEGLHGCR